MLLTTFTTLYTKFKWHQERRYIEILKGIFHLGFQSKISTEFLHDLCMTQPVLLSLSKSIVFLHILSKGSELCPGRGAPLAQGLPQDQLPPAEGTHEPRRVQGPRVPPDPGRQKQRLGFHRTPRKGPLSLLLRSDSSGSISELGTVLSHCGTIKSVLQFSALNFSTAFSAWFLPVSSALSLWGWKKSTCSVASKQLLHCTVLINTSGYVKCFLPVLLGVTHTILRSKKPCHKSCHYYRLRPSVNPSHQSAAHICEVII